MSDWWLISERDVSIIRSGLEASTHEANDFNCGNTMEPICRGCQGNDLRKVALLALDTGLNETDEIPRDFRFCPECGELRPDDDRVKNGMKCSQCAY